MFCTKCGKDLNAEDLFCARCGVPTTAKLPTDLLLEEIQDPAGGYRLPQVATPGDISNPRQGKDLMLYGMITIVISLMVACGAAGKYDEIATLGIIGAVVGAGLLIVGKMQHWYNWE
jgi:hypothetical protein